MVYCKKITFGNKMTFTGAGVRREAYLSGATIQPTPPSSEFIHLFVVPSNTGHNGDIQLFLLQMEHARSTGIIFPLRRRKLVGKGEKIALFMDKVQVYYIKYIN